MKEICTISKILSILLSYHICQDDCGGNCRRSWTVSSLLAEGLAVGALILGGICLMGAHQNVVQGAIICIVAVVCALGNGTFNALVRTAVHNHFLLFSGWP